MTLFLEDIANKLSTLRKHHDTRSPDHRGNGGARAVHEQRGNPAADVCLQHLQLAVALSAVGDGLNHIATGRVEEGLKLARHGLEYLRDRIGEAQS